MLDLTVFKREINVGGAYVAIPVNECRKIITEIESLRAELWKALDVFDLFSSVGFYDRKGTLIGGTGPEATGATWVQESSPADKYARKRAMEAVASIEASGLLKGWGSDRTFDSSGLLGDGK
jgi:hypothetical protein